MAQHVTEVLGLLHDWAAAESATARDKSGRFRLSPVTTRARPNPPTGAPQ